METGAVATRAETDAVVQVVGVGTPQATGSFRFWFADQRWEWSDEVAAMHGYEPGSVTPTTELLLSHKHPDDRAQVAQTIAKSLRDAEPFCSRHRIIDLTGQTHHVIVFGDTMTDNDGNVVGTAGYYIDLTETFDEQRQEMLDGALPELFESRAVIEQAKGVLMRVYRINAEQAFRVLQWRSQETNVKLRTLATRLITELDSLPPAPPREQTAFDHLLLTLHEHAGPEQ
ncbi:PAS and ANTAR domain-containing protein [Nocardia iowensis]|uniref:PAS and ANTAR domain-containing protein n=1 Tax=Nocardia iowensis TaxID=204891 RepID=A0ABX8S0L9_NOCIO|nr:PAS and ANTAR domain-containing protein [Nocardia iowensis]QXN95453.1 PAS and ANTAR domain-containing protein [Nocardia iowensis]